jgi:hypothetical protein
MALVDKKANGEGLYQQISLLGSMERTFDLLVIGAFPSAAVAAH